MKHNKFSHDNIKRWVTLIVRLKKIFSLCTSTVTKSTKLTIVKLTLCIMNKNIEYAPTDDQVKRSKVPSSLCYLQAMNESPVSYSHRQLCLKLNSVNMIDV